MESVQNIQEMQDMIRQLNLMGKRLSKGHRRIVEYIEEHYDKAVFMTASRLGEKVGVSESTVVRFALAMGYEGYPQLQKALQELVRHRLTATQRFTMASGIDPSAVLRTVLKTDMQNIRATIDDCDEAAFEQAVEGILNARRIYILGMRSAAPLAQFMGYYLHFIFQNMWVLGEGINDVFEQVSHIGKDDVLLGISFPRYSKRTLEAMTIAKGRGAMVIGLTDGPMSPLHKVSTFCLTAHTDMTTFVDSLAAPLSLINALIAALGIRRKKELSEHFAQMEGIWDAYGVYLGQEKRKA